MYLEFFKLRELPFSNVNDDRFFFETATHAEALSSMVYTVQQRKGMVLITGEVGAGKTYLGNMLSSRLGSAAQVVFVRHPAGSAKQLLRAASSGFGIAVAQTGDLLTLTDELDRGLQQLHRRKRLAALVIDETQDMPDEAMEEVRLMWNWEQDGQRLLQIVLIGQPELRLRLQGRRWDSLRQRVVLAHHLGRLTCAETAGYVRHRLRVAANGDARECFTPGALEDIHRITKGTPRLINTTCDNALLTAYARGEPEVSSTIVRDVAESMALWSPEVPGSGEAPPPAPPGAQATGLGGTGEAPDVPRVADGSAPEPADGDAELLKAALKGEPSLEMARKVYRLAPAGSEEQHLAIRIITHELVRSIQSKG
jgi:general secretion pathway protein A